MGVQCKNCSHAILCNTFGEYKCTARKMTIYNLETHKDCEFFKTTKTVNLKFKCKNCETRTEDE